MGRGRLMVIAGRRGPEAGEKPRVRHRTAQVHHAARRRGGLAARRECAPVQRAMLYERSAQIGMLRGMKTLFLIRHAKSSWDDTALPDKDRPLANRGRRDAPKMGRRLAKREVKPDLILSSPARRALTTAEIIAKKLDYKRKNIVVEDRPGSANLGGLPHD